MAGAQLRALIYYALYLLQAQIMYLSCRPVPNTVSTGKIAPVGHVKKDYERLLYAKEPAFYDSQRKPYPVSYIPYNTFGHFSSAFFLEVILDNAMAPRILPAIPIFLKDSISRSAPIFLRIVLGLR